MKRKKDTSRHKPNRYLIWSGGALLLVTFVVRDEWREGLKDEVQSIDTARDNFLVQQQNADIANQSKDALEVLNKLQNEIEHEKSIFSRQREMVYTIAGSVDTFNQRVAVRLANIRRLLSVLPNQQSYNNRLTTLETEREAIAKSRAELSLTSGLLDIPTADLPKAVEDAVGQLAIRTSALENAVQPLEIETLSYAENASADERRHYERVTYASAALSVLLIAAGTVGKLFEKDVVSE